MNPLASLNPWFSKGKVSETAGESVSFLFWALEARVLEAGGSLEVATAFEPLDLEDVIALGLGSFFTERGAG